MKQNKIQLTGWWAGIGASAQILLHTSVNERHGREQRAAIDRM